MATITLDSARGRLRALAAAWQTELRRRARPVGPADPAAPAEPGPDPVADARALLPALRAGRRELATAEARSARLGQELGRGPLVWEPRRYATAQVLGGLGAAIAAYGALAGLLAAPAALLAVAAAGLAAHLVGLAHLAGKGLRQAARRPDRRSRLVAHGSAALALAQAALVVGLPAAAGLASGLAWPLLLAATVAALVACAYLRHDPDPDYEGAQAALARARERHGAMLARYEAALADARARFEQRLEALARELAAEAAPRRTRTESPARA